MELKKIDLTPSTSAVDSPVSSKPNPVKIDPMPKTSAFPIIKVVGLIVALVLGLGLGYFAKSKIAGGAASRPDGSVIARNVPSGGLKEGDIIGVQDEKTFKDTVTGVLESGGMDGEGSHHLLRPGGASQTVYLTSSVIDLDQFVGAQVTVWGETFKGQKAGWLMDVGRVRVEKLNAPTP